ncbi:hypothetical protein BP00DRAFT_423404 [Aspergillus indologenus CBS 114.80]|uniref:Uncharacterized protein n=1 Tax=Aspergillus indologenus CBS 114.80 TaxID=1450541 RepID=A0A2V5IBH9_9EURO|nr:hypothetical protein BP00DRAFT_423404 [Aspergillus indologenus CBS 114.80]
MVRWGFPSSRLTHPPATLEPRPIPIPSLPSFPVPSPEFNARFWGCLTQPPTVNSLLLSETY